MLVASAEKPPAPAPSPFAVVARFASGANAQLHALGDRPAVKQQGSGPWSLATLTRDGRIVELASRLSAEERSGDVLTVAGELPGSAFVSTYFVGAEGAMQFNMSTWQVADGKAPTSVAPVGFRGMGALHEGHWVGLPFAVHPGYLIDDPPQKFRTFRGKGTLPTIPPKLSLYQVAFLGNGKACGVGALVGEQTMLRARLWTEDGRTFPLDDAPDADRARVFRGAGGECVLVAPGKSGTSFIRIRGDKLSTVESKRHATALSAARDGAIWLFDEDHNDAVIRIRLREDAVDETVFAVPSLGECKSILGSLVAFSDDDVWLTAGCNDARQVLLHTQPAPAKVDEWPPPPPEPAPRP